MDAQDVCFNARCIPLDVRFTLRNAQRFLWRTLAVQALSNEFIDCLVRASILCIDAVDKTADQYMNWKKLATDHINQINGTIFCSFSNDDGDKNGRRSTTTEFMNQVQEQDLSRARRVRETIFPEQDEASILDTLRRISKLNEEIFCCSLSGAMHWEGKGDVMVIPEHVKTVEDMIQWCYQCDNGVGIQTMCSDIRHITDILKCIFNASNDPRLGLCCARDESHDKETLQYSVPFEDLRDDLFLKHPLLGALISAIALSSKDQSGTDMRHDPHLDIMCSGMDQVQKIVLLTDEEIDDLVGKEPRWRMRVLEFRPRLWNFVNKAFRHENVVKSCDSLE